MKLVSYIFGGQQSFGYISGDGVVDLSARLSNMLDMKAALGADIAELQKWQSESPDVALTDIEFLPPVPNPHKIICVGINYVGHIKETGREPPRYPWLFVRFANSLVGHGQAMRCPSISDKYDFEGELAVVIGKPAHRVDEANAMEHVAGYSCFNDGSVRDYQRHSPLFTAGKNFLNSGAFGPYLVTADEAPAPREMHLQTHLNGKLMQDSGVDDLCFDIPYLIAYCSRFTELQTGDVIATGTPGGVGYARDPMELMQPGDQVCVSISGVGELSNPIEAESSSS